MSSCFLTQHAAATQAEYCCCKQQAHLDVVDLIEYDDAGLCNNLRAVVQHRAENFCCQNQARSIWVDCDVPSHQPHIRELFHELFVLLIAQRLQWGCINNLRVVHGPVVVVLV